MFQYAEEAPAANGCGVTFMGEFWYFGSVNKVSLNYFLSIKIYDIINGWLRQVRSLAVSLSGKWIWNLTSTMDLAIHS